MNAPWEGRELLQPITADRPCGENLEDTPLLASFDTFRLFGRTKPLDTPPDLDEGAPKTLEDRDERPPDWAEIKSKSLEALGKTKDLRLLAHLGAALLRTDGIHAFVETISIASHWLETYWNETYPPVDEDGILRRSALNCFADPIAVVEALRRAPIVNSRQHGPLSLRDIDVATGQLPDGSSARPDDARVNATFGIVPLEDLTALQQRIGRALTSLKNIDAKMRAEIGTEATPSFDSLSTQLQKMEHVLRVQVAARPGGATNGGATAAVDAAGATTGAAAAVPGVISSRDEAIRALDAVADFFRRTEPSSPIPLFCDRAKRLVSKDFFEVLADVAPEAMSSARAASGLRTE